jgi:hypothetical protein
MPTSSRFITGRNAIASVLLMLCSAGSLTAQQARPAPNWERWAFLLGDWLGEGGGAPGQGTGTFSFSVDLDTQVIVRKNHSDYPASNDRPAYSHDDLMITYQESGTPLRAIYFDTEGHVIRYVVTFPGSGNAVVFTSEPSNASPRFRLTYTETGKGSVGIKFEIAPPGKPEAFTTYIEAKARRK